MNETQGETAFDPRLTWFIAIGNLRSWGRAQSEKQAIANMHREARSWQHNRKTDEYIVYRVSEQTTVTDQGWLSWPKDGGEPVKIKHVKPKK